MTDHSSTTRDTAYGHRRHYWIDSDLYARHMESANAHVLKAAAIIERLGRDDARHAILDDAHHDLSDDAKVSTLAFIDAIATQAGETKTAPLTDTTADIRIEGKKLQEHLRAAIDLMRFRNFVRPPTDP